jgi:aromatic-L-amino-acid decarboxylase
MDPGDLEFAIAEDRAHGWQPFCVVATTGTTSTTSIDPVPAIADICERDGMWLHVDAAYGGSAAVVPELRWVLEGCDRADSLVINPHKGLFVPVDLSVLYCRQMHVLRRAFSLVPEYLRSGEGNEVKNFMDYGPQLGRRFRALKFWFVMRYFGVDGLRERIRNQLELAREFAGLVEKSRDFELLAPVPLGLVCFRARSHGVDEERSRNSETNPKLANPNRQLEDAENYINILNELLLEEVNRRGKVFLSHTKLDGRFTLRLAIGNIRTTHDHVRLAWDELNTALDHTRARVRNVWNDEE